MIASPQSLPHVQDMIAHDRSIEIYRTFHNVPATSNLAAHCLLLALETVKQEACPASCQCCLNFSGILGPYHVHDINIVPDYVSYISPNLDPNFGRYAKSYKDID